MLFILFFVLSKVENSFIKILKNTYMFKLRQRTIIETLLIVACIALIVYFMPRDTNFNYHFSVNTPWSYGQLMSDFDFPIYKSSEKVEAERDSLFKQFQPYFYMDSSATEKAIIA